MNITAVITHYYKERLENLNTILEALDTSSLRPKEIIVWNNDKEIDMAWYLHDLGWRTVKVIETNHNYGSGSWLLAAAMAENPWIFQQDNDLLVEEGTLRNFSERVGLGFQWFGLEGRDFSGCNSYRNSILVRKPTSNLRVDILLARMTMLKKSTAIGILAELPPIGTITDDDLHVSKRAYSYVIPYGNGEGFINLEENGIGLSHQSGHYERREKVVKELWGNR